MFPDCRFTEEDGVPLLPDMTLSLPPRGFLQRRALANAHAAVERDRIRAAERKEAAAVLAAAAEQAEGERATRAS